ncbi:uncharacterized protein LOC135953975 [Calliphora vicina]|uniref:uncharacterized protein LOC135953975 n=1 Tax=Calliphora vicina TaxID=7373 RepID=UPI00325B3108
MTVVSNGQFWIYTLAILIIWIIVLSTAFTNDSNMKNKVSSPNSNNDDEMKNTGNCKSLCKHCGCLGFYCGEECICECNNDHSDTECIGLIQMSAKKMNIPFEVLIQGPTANNFVRNAFQFEQNNERRSYGYRNKRSTVTVYKPNKNKHETTTKQNLHKMKSSCERKTLVKDIFNVAKSVKDRRKRSPDQFNWFNDFGQNLLRPAPLGGYKRKSEETKIPASFPKSSTVSSIFDNSWFSQNTRNILTPAPLIKRNNYKQSTGDIYNENDVDSSLEALKVDDKFSDDFADNHEMETIYSDELKDGQIDNKDSYLSEEKKPEESQDTLTSRLFSRLFKDDKVSFLPEEKKPEESQDALTNRLYSRLFREDKVSFSPEEKPPEEESMETLTSGLYSRLFKDDLNKNEDNDLFVSEEEKKLDESLESITGSLYSRLFKEDLSKIDDKKEEKKQDESQEPVTTGGLYSRLFKDDLSESPKKVKKGLHEFRIPWFKPGMFFEKVKRVIRP